MEAPPLWWLRCVVATLAAALTDMLTTLLTVVLTAMLTAALTTALVRNQGVAVDCRDTVLPLGGVTFLVL